MRLIDADALCNTIEKKSYIVCRGLVYPKYEEGMKLKDIRRCIEETPSIIQKEWISVKDRLPEKSGDYIVCSAHDGHALPKVVYFDNSAGWYDSAITHWMPLPKPPEE